MRRRAAVLIAASAVVLVAAGGIGIALATASAPATETPVSAGSAAPTRSESPNASATPAPDAASPGLSETDGSAQQQGGAPAPDATLPRVLPGQAPASGSAQGALASGFPETVPVAPQSTILSSSLSSEGTRVQASLTAKSSLSDAALLDFYRAEFAKYGLLDVPVPASEGSTALLFTRDDDSITLSLTPVDGGVDYIVFGALTARG